MDTSPSPPSPPPSAAAAAAMASAFAARSTRSQQYNPEENTITNICTSNIILDLPQVTTRSRTGATKPQPPAPAPPNPPTVAKIIIKQTQLPSGAVTVTAINAATSPRQPPPLQQMQGTSLPRLQQMVHAQAPPPLQAKPRGGGGGGGAVAAPPPLQIKVVAASRQKDPRAAIIVTSSAEAPAASSAVEVGQAGEVETGVEEVAEEGVSSGMNSPGRGGECVPPAEGGFERRHLNPRLVSQMEVEVNVAAVPSATPAAAASRNICVRAGCTRPAVESQDWDMEYCSNECVATHCRCVRVTAGGLFSVEI